MRSDYEEDWDSSDTARCATGLEAKYKFYFSRFVPDVILTLKFGKKRFVGRARLLKQISERLGELERSVRTPLAWAIVEDRGLRGRLFRFHLLISGTADIEDRNEWEFKAPHQIVRRRNTGSDTHGTAMFLAKNGISESNEFHFGGGLIENDPETPDEMHQNAVNPRRKKVVERGHVPLGSDPKCKILPVQVFIEARGCDDDGRGSGYGYVVANTGAKFVKWHDGWSRDEAIYHAIGRAIEDVQTVKQVLFLVPSKAVVNRFESDAPNPGRMHRELLRFLARTVLRMRELRLEITVEWTSRKTNLAPNLLSDQSREAIQSSPTKVTTVAKPVDIASGVQTTRVGSRVRL